MFYVLSYDDKISCVKYSNGTDWESIKCSKDPGHQRAGNRIGDLRIDLRRKKVNDFEWTFLSECVVSDKVVSLFTKHKLTGYELKAVEVNNRELPYKLWAFIVTGKGGDAHPDSGIYLKKKCDICNLIRYSAYEHGIIVDENHWDGSDFFTINGYSRHILISSKVVKILNDNNLTGITLTPASELRWSDSIIKP